MPKSASRKPASAKATAAPEPGGPAQPEAVPAKPAGKASKAAKTAKTSRKKAVPAKPSQKEAAKGKAKRAVSSKKVRLPPRKTFLVAATRPGDAGAAALEVYAAVTRSPAEALAAARAELGPDVAVELTGKLSNRMAKGLGLKPGALHPI